MRDTLCNRPPSLSLYRSFATQKEELILLTRVSCFFLYVYTSSIKDMLVVTHCANKKLIFGSLLKSSNKFFVYIICTTKIGKSKLQIWKNLLRMQPISCKPSSQKGSCPPLWSHKPLYYTCQEMSASSSLSTWHELFPVWLTPSNIF